MRTRYKIVLVVVVVGISVLCSCRGSRGGTLEDSNDFSSSIPCWNQSWRAGEWEPLTYKLKAEDVVIRDLPNEEVVILSMCGWCESVRIIDPKNELERIILSSKGKTIQCRHRWISAINPWSFEPVVPRDALFIIYKNQLYVVKIQHIIWDDRKIACQIGKVAHWDEALTNVKLTDITWETLAVQEKIPVADRTITFRLRPIHGDDANRFITIKYDQYYGSIYGPEARSYEDSAHIAIVHRAYLAENPIVDLMKFRFKTWEDGLGNRCDETAASDEPAVDKEAVSLGLHEGPVRDIVSAPDGSYIVTTGDDGQIVIKHLDYPLRKIVGPIGHELRFWTLAVSQSGTDVLGGGDPHAYFKFLVKVNVSDGRYEEINAPFMGSVKELSYYNNDNGIAYITADNKLSFFDLEHSELIGSHDIFGGFIGDVAVSPKQDFFAVISMNSIEYKHAEPCKLTVFDEKGNETLSYQFESCRGTYYDKMAFLGSERLALCLPRGEMLQWKWLSDEQKWKRDKKVRITSGLFSAIESSPDGKTIWLAKDNSVIAIDSASGQTLDETTFDIGEIKSDFVTPPITVIELVPQKEMLAVGLGDGRVGLMSIRKK